MKFPNTAVMALAASVGSASAFTVGRTFMGRSVVGTAPAFAKTGVANTATRGISSTGMTMIFENLFGGGGGAQAATIAYENLDHPGPELAKFAEEGTCPAMSPLDPHLALATFAGGCFWGLELAYMRVPGVHYTAVGYSQGPAETKYPNYSQVCSGGTGHTEAVMVYYDPTETSYETLLDTFFGRINPTTVNGQGNDRGTQYRTGVYTHSPEQKTAADARFALEAVKYGSKKIASENLPATAFWPAEKYHQQYLEKGGQNADKGASETIRCYG
jgi:peptide-methionine (S)-S-oxide reductase